ncbi:MAG TPA: TIGR04551 family protein [Myxococcota bacterium]|nr:TIGR04551 family protein [Myxococcota bacterium]HRY95364.1 TIGR04551 family protein [Myxococcota bacterium]
MSRQAWLALALLAAGLPGPAGATGFTDIGQDLEQRAETEVEVHGALRLRGELLYNLDLDRGVDPAGEPLYPVPPGDPTGQLLTNVDMRLRTDLSLFVPRAQLAVKLRVDVLDNLGLGSDPSGPPVGTVSQEAPELAFRVKRAYGEVLLPFGLLAAGRLGSHWGLGMLTNGGDCADCDSGDASDGLALMSPLLGHVLALAYTFSSTGPFTDRRSDSRFLDLEPSDDVRTFTLALLKFHNDQARERRRQADRTSFEYGLYASYRWQDNDIPAGYLSLARPESLGPGSVMARGLQALALDLWLRLTLPRFRLELEGAVMLAEIEEPSLVPGALLREPVYARQFGLALESEYGAPEDDWGVGLDAGFASGDPAPGFNAFPQLDDTAGQPGALRGAQARPPYDNRFDDFRFHPDYRVDRILFRELIGTVTDAVYVRPHARYRLLQVGQGELVAQLSAVASFAVEPASTPGGERPLGVELDPTLAYVNELGFQVVADYAVLFPLGGLDNPAQGLSAKPAQLFQVRLAYGF